MINVLFRKLAKPILSQISEKATQPMWTPTRLWPKLLRKHYLFIVIAIAISLAGLLFHYASEFSDSLLFYMKLLSFSTTALLGVIGIMVDFKDDEKKLTVAGKLNLVGLVFVAVVGVAAQRAEAVKSARSSAEDRKSVV